MAGAAGGARGGRQLAGDDLRADGLREDISNRCGGICAGGASRFAGADGGPADFLRGGPAAGGGRCPQARVRIGGCYRKGKRLVAGTVVAVRRNEGSGRIDSARRNVPEQQLGGCTEPADGVRVDGGPGGVAAAVSRVWSERGAQAGGCRAGG